MPESYKQDNWKPALYQGSAWLVFDFGDAQYRYRFGADQERNRAVIDDLATDLQEMSEIGYINQRTKEFVPLGIYSAFE